MEESSFTSSDDERYSKYSLHVHDPDGSFSSFPCFFAQQLQWLEKHLVWVTNPTRPSSLGEGWPSFWMTEVKVAGFENDVETVDVGSTVAVDSGAYCFARSFDVDS